MAAFIVGQKNMEKLVSRWSIFIDIEGFSKIYPDNMVQALMPLCSIMKAIFSVGNLVCPESPERLFAHQIGDGFIIVSESSERSPELPLALGIFLLRSTLLAGGMGKCSISQGDFSDIKGCYPEIILNNRDASGTVRMGRGLMHLFPVMGSALINAYRLGNRESGSLLIIDSILAASLPKRSVVTKTTDDYQVVDWIHTNTPEIKEIETKTGIQHPKVGRLEEKVRLYVDSNCSSLPKEWENNTLSLNGITLLKK